jgi:hypothetical protein
MKARGVGPKRIAHRERFVRDAIKPPKQKDHRMSAGWDNQTFLELVHARVLKRHAYKCCGTCRRWVDNRNARRHSIACRREATS